MINEKGKGVLVNEDKDKNIGVDLDEEAYVPNEDEFDVEYDIDDGFDSNDDDLKFINIRD